MMNFLIFKPWAIQPVALICWTVGSFLAGAVCQEFRVRKGGKNGS